MPLGFGERQLGAVKVEADVAAIDPERLGVPDGLQRPDQHGGGIPLGPADRLGELLPDAWIAVNPFARLKVA